MNSRGQSIPFGGTTLREHRHVCAFFNSAAEEYETLLPFICDGINCGERAFHVLPRQHREDHIQQLRNAGIDVEKTIESRQLEIAPKYLGVSTKFSLALTALCAARSA